MKTNPRSKIATFRNVGVDIGKSTLDVYIFETELHIQAENSPERIRTLVSKLSRYKLARVIVEATGNYERWLVEALAEKELPVIVVQPMKVRDFAKAQGILAKTD